MTTTAVATTTTLAVTTGKILKAMQSSSIHEHDPNTTARQRNKGHQSNRSTNSEVPYIHDQPIVSEFPDVFPDELPGIPPVREV
nr:putative reverse transcriptase domain-containing protein [Tanacetum cinerariifolium]